MTYSEKLKDIRWQKKRLCILSRDQWICQYCLVENKPLNVHHKVYIKGRDPWNYPGEVLISLCDNCHKEAEEEKQAFFNLVNILVFDGYSYEELTAMFYEYNIKFSDPNYVNPAF